MLSAVIDNNVLISGILNDKGIPGKILDAAVREEFILITSEPLLGEFKHVLLKLSTKYPRIVPEREKLINFLSWHSVGSPPLLDPSVVKEDPDDDRVLECAQATQANYVVSGNSHLIKLERFHGIPILRPREFFAILK